MKEQSDKSESTRLSRKFVMSRTDFFFMYNLKSQELNLYVQLFYKKILGKGLSFYIYFVHFVRIWNFKWPGKKKTVLGQKKAANYFFDADHHFEKHKIWF